MNIIQYVNNNEIIIIYYDTAVHDRSNDFCSGGL